MDVGCSCLAPRFRDLEAKIAKLEDAVGSLQEYTYRLQLSFEDSTVRTRHEINDLKYNVHCIEEFIAPEQGED